MILWFLTFVLWASSSLLSIECSMGAWSSSYFVNGVISVPYAEIEEPFTAWYDENNGASRIDYYGGMMKTYQLKHQPGQFGSLSKIVPVTDGKNVNLNRCLQINGSKSFSVDTQSVLPDLSNYKFVSHQVLNTLETEKWQYFMEMDNGNKNNTYTMYLTYETSSLNSLKSRKSQAKQPIPVRFEMQGYNTLLGSHYDHYYIDYMNYNDDPIPSNVFTITEGMPCTSFPGPGSQSSLKRFSFNPMIQFIETKKSYNLFQKLFHSFKFMHKKVYKDEHEHEKRHFEFLHNHRFIESTNRANLGFQLKINHLADRSKDELKNLRGRTYRNEYNGGLEFQYTEKDVKGLINDSFDWRLLGAVTPVKDQSFCGSCWSFASTGEIEGAYFLKYGKLVRFSEQALIDCSWEFQNNGCDGGEDFRSYKWILKHGGLPTNEQYGNYLGADGYCHFENMTLIGTIDKYYNVTTNDENALRVALVQHGPISVSIDASPKTFSFYSHGLYYDVKCKNKIDELDHAVLLVGYGQWNGQLYWLIKNSWSTYWGNDGYILISAKNNNCGVMTDPTFVTLK